MRIYSLIVALLVVLFFNGKMFSQWTLTTAPVTTIYGSAVHGSKIFIAQIDSGVFLSTNDGESWVPRNNNLFLNVLAGIEIFGDTVYAFSESIQKMHVDDTTWSDYTTIQYMNSLFVSGSFYISSYFLDALVFTSTDYGFNWTASTITNKPTSPFKNIFYTGNSFLAAHTWGIYRSSDNGANWDSVKGGIPSPQTNTFLNHSSGIFAGGSLNFFPMLLKSTNDGVTWNNVPTTGFSSGGITSLSSSGPVIFCTVTGRGVYYSTNFGSNWTIANTGITSPNFANKIFINGNNAFVSANGLWKRPLSQLTSMNDESDAEVPESYSLFQNFPNPFNPSTRIQYQIAGNSNVSLRIYDVLGNEVTTLIDEFKPAGIYEVDFDATRLASGIYYYKLLSGSFVEIKKMILIK